MTEQQLHSHHWSAILKPREQLQAWTEERFVDSIERAVRQAQLTPINHTGFTFQPQGISVVVLLEESHVALHYWPEKGKLSIDIHVCDYQQSNREKAEVLASLLGRSLSPTPVEWHYLTLAE